MCKWFVLLSYFSIKHKGFLSFEAYLEWAFWLSFIMQAFSISLKFNWLMRTFIYFALKDHILLLILDKYKNVQSKNWLF